MFTSHTALSHSRSMKIIRAFWQDEEAATAVEYALIASLIGAFIAAAATLLGNNISTLFNQIAIKIGSVHP